jgi:hypothetical protein
VTVQTFKQEIAAAVRAYDRHVVCLEKTTETCEAALYSLVEKAIRAYENRGPGLRHGIALDKHLTVILSETEGDRPLCGIYFNLRSPYQRKPAPKQARATG